MNKPGRVERVDMSTPCGTNQCIAGWAYTLWRDDDCTGKRLGLTNQQFNGLCCPPGWSRYDHDHTRYTRTDAIAAIQSMLDSPDDDALPVWPAKATEPSA